MPLDPSLAGATVGSKAGFDLTVLFGSAGIEICVPEPPRYEGRRFPSIRAALQDGDNAVTNVRDAPHAVLVRALEPVEGIARMRRRRPGRADHDLTNGPGKLCAALGISRSLDGADLLGPRVWLEEGRREVRASQIAVGPRVGIDYAQEWADKPWRFWIKGNPYVSRSATPRLTPRPRSS